MRKITRIKRSIRAISPVISVLLMIAIAVIAALVAYAWVMGYINFQGQKADNRIEIQSYTSSGNLIVYVQNTGQGIVHLKQDSSVYVNDVLKEILNADIGNGLTYVDPAALIPINPGQTVTIEVNYQNFQPGDRIKIVTVEGAYAEITGTSNSDTNGQGSQITGPTARFRVTPASPIVNQLATFTDTSTAGAATITQWSWSFGSNANPSSSTSRNPTTTYSVSGQKTVTLIVTDANGNTSTTTRSITVETVAPQFQSPTAEFSMSTTTPLINQNVGFTDISILGSGAITFWSWTFGDGTSSTAQNPMHSYTTAGEKAVTLTITDINGKTSTVTHTLNVDYASPTANFNYAPSSPIIDQEIAFTDTSVEGSGTINSWSWSFGDGQTSSIENPTHSYTTTGAKTVTLTVLDSNGKTSTTSRTVNVGSTVTPTPTPSSEPTPTPTATTEPTNNKLAFVAGAPQNLQTNTPSEKITIQRQDSTGTPIITGSTTITLTATAGTFYSDAACTIAITAPITINYPASTYDFYYKCPTAGSQTLTATATDYQTATTTFSLTTQQPTTYTVTYTVNNVAYGSVSPSGTISGYAYGAQVDIRATANPGYIFTSWTRSGDINIANTGASQTTATILGDGSIIANFQAQPTDKLVFTEGRNQYLELNRASARITIERQTSSGTPITTGTTTINLASTSSGGNFYRDSACTQQITQSSPLTITSGSSAYFYYKDSNTGTPTITASATEFTSVQTTFNVNTRCTGFEGTNWLYGWTVGSQPPWYRGVGEGVDGTDCAKSDPYGINSGAFTANSLNTESANTITITFQYKVAYTETNDFQIFYSVVTNPNLDQDSPHFILLATLSSPGNDGWNTYTATFTKASNPTMFDPTFWFRFQSDLEIEDGVAELVWVDNVVISVT